MKNQSLNIVLLTSALVVSSTSFAQQNRNQERPETFLESNLAAMGGRSAEAVGGLVLYSKYSVKVEGGKLRGFKDLEYSGKFVNGRHAMVEKTSSVLVAKQALRYAGVLAGIYVMYDGVTGLVRATKAYAGDINVAGRLNGGRGLGKQSERSMATYTAKKPTSIGQ